MKNQIRKPVVALLLPGVLGERVDHAGSALGLDAPDPRKERRIVQLCRDVASIAPDGLCDLSRCCWPLFRKVFSDLVFQYWLPMRDGAWSKAIHVFANIAGCTGCHQVVGFIGAADRPGLAVVNMKNYVRRVLSAVLTGKVVPFKDFPSASVDPVVFHGNTYHSTLLYARATRKPVVALCCPETGGLNQIRMLMRKTVHITTPSP